MSDELGVPRHLKPPPFRGGYVYYRLENWKFLRAFGLPYFFRSTARLSRVRNFRTFIELYQGAA
jgi:hypothetical protein